MSATERPILFSGAMVRAILDGHKTQTRRVVKPQPGEFIHVDFDERRGWHLWWDCCKSCGDPDVWQEYADLKCPYGAVGDRLWARETWATPKINDHYRPRDTSPVHPIYYAADASHGKLVRWSDEETELGKLRPSIFMPRWASRITLEITGIRVERVQDIGKDGRKAHDVLAEGITDANIEHWRKWLHPDDAPAHTYGVLWDSINGKRPGCSWAANPWVWVVEFKPVAPAEKGALTV